MRDAHPTPAAAVVVAERPAVCLVIPMDLQSEANSRQHKAEASGRVHAQRFAALCALRSRHPVRPPLPAGVVVVRVVAPPRKFFDSDNVARAAKAVRDGIADYLRVDDGDARLLWAYEQEEAPPGLARDAVRIEMYSGALPCPHCRRRGFIVVPSEDAPP